MEHHQLLSSENTVPSSSSPALFSDGPQHVSSPPSSPPGFPWESTLNVTEKPLQRPAINAFSVLGKRKALGTIGDNARPTKRTNVQPNKLTSKSLTQLQISLGQVVQKRCKTCGMEYVPSSAEDTKLHDKYHKQCTEGYDVGKDFVQKVQADPRYRISTGARSGDTICALDGYNKAHLKRKAQAVLEVVQRELGAVEIPENDVWYGGVKSFTSTGGLRYKAFLYIRKSRCIGFLLVQSIDKAFRVEERVLRERQLAEPNQSEKVSPLGSAAALKARLETETERLREIESLPIELSKKTFPAHLGICRIWTSPSKRHQNIATALLDRAFDDYNDHTYSDQAAVIKAREGNSVFDTWPTFAARNVPLIPAVEGIKGKSLVAFSQPTEAGTRLARRWFGKMFGWCVYAD